MAKPWDDTMKKLIRANPQAFIQWFVPGATFVKERLNELDNVKLEMDGLLEALKDEQKMLVHLEFQAYNDPSMPERLLRYNVLTRMQYKLPVLSCVLYLLRDGDNPKSPLVWEIPGREEVLQFHFRSIEVAELSPEDILQINQPGLLPLLPLTKGGARREKVELMFEKLGSTGKSELELIGFTLASLVYRRESKVDQEWLIRRFHEMHDILRETPIYQEILREGQEEAVQAFRQAIIEIIQERFPKLERLAKKQITFVEDVATLRLLTVKVGTAQNAEEVRQHLLAVDEDEDQ